MLINIIRRLFGDDTIANDLLYRSAASVGQMYNDYEKVKLIILNADDIKYLCAMHRLVSLFRHKWLFKVEHNIDGMKKHYESFDYLYRDLLWLASHHDFDETRKEKELSEEKAKEEHDA